MSSSSAFIYILLLYNHYFNGNPLRSGRVTNFKIYKRIFKHLLVLVTNVLMVSKLNVFWYLNMSSIDLATRF